jgi:type III pantothenate kinase
MDLCIDAGNTRIKWGMHDGRGWAATGAVETAEAASLEGVWMRAPAAQRAFLSNVAERSAFVEIQRICSAMGSALRVVRPAASQLGVTNGYREPTQLGSDRWAALIAAHHAARGHKLVVCAGTALTIDALTAEGQFLGGLIVAGPTLMRRALDRGTAGLRLTEGVFAEFPASTPEAIASGAVQACTGAIMRMHEAMAKRGQAPERILLSGGAAGELAPHLAIEHAIHENLVLDGLALIARAG